MTTPPSPAPRGTRARDADRQLVVDSLSEAHATGQLSFDEYEERSRAASAAVTLQQLAPLTADLQGAPSLHVPAMSTAAVGIDLSDLVGAAPRPSVGRAIVGMAIVFAVAIGAIFAVGAAFNGTSVFGADKPDLQSAEGIDDFVSAVEAEFGTTLVDNAVVYPEYAVVYVPIPDHPTHLESYYYDGGFDEPSTGSTRESDEPLVDLSQLRGGVAEQLIDQGPQALGVTDPTSVYVIMESWGDPAQPVFLLYANNDYDNGYLTAAADGHLLDAYPVED